MARQPRHACAQQCTQSVPMTARLVVTHDIMHTQWSVMSRIKGCRTQSVTTTAASKRQHTTRCEMCTTTIAAMHDFRCADDDSTSALAAHMRLRRSVACCRVRTVATAPHRCRARRNATGNTDQHSRIEARQCCDANSQRNVDRAVAVHAHATTEVTRRVSAACEAGEAKKNWTSQKKTRHSQEPNTDRPQDAAKRLSDIQTAQCLETANKSTTRCF